MMIIKPTLLLDTCALRHLDQLTLGRRPLLQYLFDAFELRVSNEVYKEVERHAKLMKMEDAIKRKRAEWRMPHCLDSSCLLRLLPDLPDTDDWYPHKNLHPNNQGHLFSPSGNAGERDLFLLFLEISCSGKIPIILSDDLKAYRIALRDLVEHKIRTGLLWITLDFVIYLVITGLKRFEGKTARNQFFLGELRGVVRDLVVRISGHKQLQQQLLTHYSSLAEMTFKLIDEGDSFTNLEKRYAKTKYR
jgi:hypothetical protein